MTHTPGKWEAKQSGYSISGRAAGPYYWVVTAPGHLAVVADMLPEDDAHLIAAAPDMLAELKSIREYIYCALGGNIPDSLNAIIARAEPQP